eukprot:TRINITY_DN33805_c0_g1_i1.p1 TRINITY_DN33805_c0_g1~~TRINITY_DN33805_c0_g1_i1.p1  ORF type:complete len:455 (+),score=69.20 TRINITY_DN33805_c0_g1_i1:49-1413(+)
MDVNGSTSYQVSDALRDRHPYSCDYSKVWIRGGGCGFGLDGVRDSILTVRNPDKSATEKEKALSHILCQLSSADMKSRLVKYNLIDALKEVALKTSAKCDKLVCQICRQLSMLPVSLAAMYFGGCCTVIVDILEQQDDIKVKIAAANAIRQIADTWDGRGLILDDHPPEGMISSSIIDPANEIDDPERRDAILFDRSEQGKRVVAQLCKCLSVDDPDLQLAALCCLDPMTTVEKGLQHALCETIFRDLNKIIEQHVNASNDNWLFDDRSTELVHKAVTVVWNVALDNLGKDVSCEVPLVPHTLGKALHQLVTYPDKHTHVKAAVTGALSTLFVKAEIKHTAVQGIYSPPQHVNGETIDLRYLLVKLLKQSNSLYEPLLKAKKSGASIPEDSEKELRGLKAVCVNTNQCIRLLAELPSARVQLKQILKDEDRTLLRQIFYSTQFENEFLGDEPRT